VLQGILPDPPAGWNATLNQAGGHLLQSWQWGEFKSRHGWTPDRVMVEGPDGLGMAQILYRAKGPISIGYVPRGPLITGDVEKVWPRLRQEIDASARSHRAIAVIIETDAPLGLAGTYRDAGLVAGPAHLQPGRTVKIPLLDDEMILKGMHQKTRYNVRLAQRRGVTVRQCTMTDADIDAFYTLLSDTSGRNEFGIHSKAYYRDFLKAFGPQARLLFAESDGHVGAAIIAAAFGNEAIYMYGASSTQHRAHGAAFYLQFEAMRWARAQGCTTYDLWGIPEIDPDTTTDESSTAIAGTKGDDWRGLFRFKTGFGGEVVSYPPTLERRYVPILPWLARKSGVIKG
jgi:lipid II:glycine glycyltransferase (peptidoglycan interpeptide bridge formation enzyme)